MKIKSKKQRKILIISATSIFFCLAVVYASFETGVILKAKGNVKVTDESCFTITDNGDGTASIDDYDKSCGTKVKIPNKINGLTVTKLSDVPIVSSTTKGFANKDITNVWFPDTLTYIGNMQFFADRITEIDIPDSVTYIGEQTFSGNKLEGELKLPSNIKSIGEVAFYDNRITKLVIPNTIKYLGNGAFTGNNLIGEDKYVYGRNSDGSIDYTTLNSYASRDTSNIEIPSNIEIISHWSFGGLIIKYIEIPSNVKIIKDEAFSMSKLTFIKLNEGLTYIDNRCFADSTLEEITIPSTIQTITATAFQGSDLKTININKKENQVSGSPWGANATINWIG